LGCKKQKNRYRLSGADNGFSRVFVLFIGAVYWCASAPVSPVGKNADRENNNEAKYYKKAPIRIHLLVR
jgi:hypothetical protein